MPQEHQDYDYIVGETLRPTWETDVEPLTNRGFIVRTIGKLVRRIEERSYQNSGFDFSDLDSRVFDEVDPVVNNQAVLRAFERAYDTKQNSPESSKRVLRIVKLIEEKWHANGFDEKSIEDKMPDYLATASTLRRYVIKRWPNRSADGMLNAITTILGIDVAASLSLDDESRARNYQYFAEIHKHSQKSSAFDKWLEPKQLIPRQMYNVRMSVLEFNRLFDFLEGRDDKTNSPEIDSRSNELFKYAIRERKYGVKLSHKSNSEIGKTWMFEDGQSFAETLIEGGQGFPAQRLTIGDRKLLMISCHTYDYEPENYGTRLISHRDKNGVHKDLSFGSTKVDFSLYLSRDGELYLDPTYRVPVRREFELVNSENLYNRLRAEQISAFFDMTQSAEVVDALNSASSETNVSKDRDDIVANLLLPRINYLKNPEQLVIVEDNKEERSIKLHGVVWHIRKLPIGWTASDAARKLADEVGVTLDANETFVRAHKRGNRKNGTVKATQFRKRENH